MCATAEEKSGDGEFNMTVYRANLLGYIQPEASSTIKERLSYLEKQGKARFTFIIDKNAEADVSYGYKNSLELFASGNDALINDANNSYVQSFARNVDRAKAQEIYNRYLKKMPELLDSSWNLIETELHDPEFKKIVYQKCETDVDCKRYEIMKLVITKLFDDYSVLFVLSMPK